MSTAANTGAALPKRLLICALGLLCYASGVRPGRWGEVRDYKREGKKRCADGSRRLRFK